MFAGNPKTKLPNATISERVHGKFRFRARSHRKPRAHLPQSEAAAPPARGAANPLARVTVARLTRPPRCCPSTAAAELEDGHVVVVGGGSL